METEKFLTAHNGKRDMEIYVSAISIREILAICEYPRLECRVHKSTEVADLVTNENTVEINQKKSRMRSSFNCVVRIKERKGFETGMLPCLIESLL
jgi:hypothetical protein